MAEIRVPDLGDMVESATISMWHYTEGDSIKKDDNLVELVTDKATFEVPSPVNGKIIDLAFSEGDVVKSGDVLAIVNEGPV